FTFCVSITAQKVNSTKEVSKSQSPESIAGGPDSLEYFSAKADEIKDAAGTFKIPTDDQIAIGNTIYNKSDVIAQAGIAGSRTADDRGGHVRSRVEAHGAPTSKSDHTFDGYSPAEVKHFKELKSQLEKGPTVQYLGKVSDSFKSHIEQWWSTVPETYK